MCSYVHTYVLAYKYQSMLTHYSLTYKYLKQFEIDVLAHLINFCRHGDYSNNEILLRDSIIRSWRSRWYKKKNYYFRDRRWIPSETANFKLLLNRQLCWILRKNVFTQSFLYTRHYTESVQNVWRYIKFSKGTYTQETYFDYDCTIVENTETFVVFFCQTLEIDIHLLISPHTLMWHAI